MWCQRKTKTWRPGGVALRHRPGDAEGKKMGAHAATKLYGQSYAPPPKVMTTPDNAGIRVGKAAIGIGGNEEGKEGNDMCGWRLWTVSC